MDNNSFLNTVKNIFTRIGEFLFVKTKLYIFDLVVLSFIIAISFLFFNHYDTSVTAMQGTKLLELTFSGRFFDFYSVVNNSWFDYTQPGYDYSVIASIPMDNQWQYCPAIYPIITYILYASINLPFYLIGLIFNVHISAIVYVTAAKAAASVALFFTYIFIKKIIGLFFENVDGKNILFTFFSSAVLIFSAFIFNQIDSFYTLFLVIGLYYLLKKNYWQAFLFMGIGCAFKYLPLMICFPLILLHHKKPWPIIKYTLIMIAPSLFSALLFLNNDGYKKTSIITEFNTQFFASKVDFGSSSVYLLFFFELLGIVIAYIYKIKEEDKGLSTIYLSCYFASVFALFLQWNPQWMLMVVPFYTLVFFFSKRKFLSFVSLLCLEVGYILFILTRFTVNVGTFMVTQGLIAQLTGKPFYYVNSFADFIIMKFGYNFSFDIISFTIFAIGTVALLIVNFKQFMKDCELCDESYKSPRYVHYLRLFAVLVYLVPNLNFFFNNPKAHVTNASYQSQFEVTYSLNNVYCGDGKIVVVGYAYETYKIPYKNSNQVMLLSDNGTQYLLDTSASYNSGMPSAKYFSTGFVVEMSMYNVPSGNYTICILVSNDGVTSLVNTGVQLNDVY